MKTRCGLFISCLLFAFTTSGQSFTNINANLLDVTFSSVAWGDYDADGDLDLISIGMDAGSNYFTKLYRNDGLDVFTEISGLPFTDMAIGDVAWGDFDNDGDLDLLMMGAANGGSAITAIYENKGNDDFTSTSISLQQVFDGSVSWADYNNDGYLDILYSGFEDASNEFKTYLYKNNQNGDFILQVDNVFPGTDKGVIKWADIDGDEDLDFFMAGLDQDGNLLAQVYKNNGNDNFLFTENNLIGIWLGDAAWGDYDMDGDPDLILSGYNFAGRICNLYQNDGDGNFSKVQETPFPAISHSSTEWGDYDNDGDLDLFLSGVDEQGAWIYYARMYVNNGNGDFTDSGLTFPLVFWGESNFGDYDGDGDLDLVLTGYDGPSTLISVILRNDISIANTSPETPDGLLAVVEDNDVNLSWLPANDAETPSAGLTYNAYLYKQGGDTLMTPMSMLSNGKRSIVENGNVSQDTSWKIKGLPGGTYFWSVQALDNNFEGSAFAPEESFVILESSIDENAAGVLNIFPNPNTGNFTIELAADKGRAQLIIEDIQGKMLFSQTLINSSTKISTEKLSPGIYLLKTKRNNSIEIRKILVE